MAETWIRLLGPPRIESAGTEFRQLRGRKAWAVLAYLALQPEGSGRARTAALLFPDAGDPLGALRWNLSELRRTLGPDSISGDPLRLRLPAGWRCDAVAALHPAANGNPNGDSDAGADPRTFDGQLLEGLSFGDCPVFESWLEDQRHRLENCVLTLLYEASLAALACGKADDAVDLATRALHLDAFNADCHAVLIRAFIALGEHRRAREQADKCRDLYHRELGLGLPAEVRRALYDAAPTAEPGLPANAATVHSYLDAAGASLSAGSVDRGLDQLRLAVELAQRTGDGHLVAESLVTLSSALIHQAGGRGAEVADLLHRALQSEGVPSAALQMGALRPGSRSTAARQSGAPPLGSTRSTAVRTERRPGASRVAAAAYRELGYLSVQRGIPDRAAGWLELAAKAADGFPDEQSRILAIKGMAASDTAHYGEALAALTESSRLAAELGSPRLLAFSEALIGRVHLQREELGLAAGTLDRALALVAAERWTSFEPFVTGLRGETYLATGRLDDAAALIDRSWVMADVAGDHCFLTLAAGAKARLSMALGDPTAAEMWLRRGLETTPWYLWYRARLLDTAAEVAIAGSSPVAGDYAAKLGTMASRGALRELLVRAHSHRAVLGDTAAAEAIPWLAKDIDNPALNAYLARRGQL
ncbi:BTAD domain-containing putative transcriptional regulator [Arthrobacter sp. ov118]|uniref:BTAD domain-containing putative transcriptional regulator n=1 Tax=Arthrobacter sp. ov118 TaxID=1761747 RepID=UPI0008E3250C|nr:BTAD domain-containing putative transcriptional regulator [Arthrobacter sp. ov118]SFT97387.1 DNA-binding transcriptional activator of the SARP family [Arthrobacter sp. ov118]